MKNSNKDLLNTLSYVALVIIAFLLVIRTFLPVLGVNISGALVSILETVQNVFIILVVGICAYNFTIGKAKWVNILFWVAVIIFVVATVLIWL